MATSTPANTGAAAPAPAGYQIKPGDANRKPGEQKPGQYPFVGPAYLHWGEQPGYIYNPYTDTYKPDPAVLANNGRNPEAPPGLLESLLPAGATAAAIFGAKEGAEALGGLLPGWLGGTPAAAAATTPEVAALGGLIGPQLPAAASGIGPIASGADYAASLASSQSALPMTGITPYLGAAGAGLGAYGLYNAIRGQDTMGAGLSGAGLGLGLGAAAPLLGLGPVGLPMLGLLALGGGLGGLGLEQAFSMGDKDRWKMERDRLQGLKDQGINIPDALLQNLNQLSGGRTKEELVAEAQRTGGNVQFAQSRNESDLKPADIMNYATFAEHDPKWFDRPIDQRTAYAQQLLDAGLVREHHGTIDVDWANAPTAPWDAGTVPPTQESDAPAPGVPSPAPKPASPAPTPPKQPAANMPLSAPVPRAAPTNGLINFNQQLPPAAPATTPMARPTMPQTGASQAPSSPQAPEAPSVGGPQDFGIMVPPGVEVPRISATKEYWEAWARNGYQAQAGESTGSLGNKYNPMGGLLGNQPPPIQAAEDPRNKYNPLGGLLGNQPPAQQPPLQDPRNKYNSAGPLMRPPGA